jgi:hypothetical protein
MTTLQDMPQVQDCTVTSCSYNDSGCKAGAITVGGDHAHCGTFVEISFRGGGDSTGLVGAATARSAASTTSWSAPPRPSAWAPAPTSPTA